MSILDKPRLYYDIEVYKHDFVLVFLNEDGSEHITLVNSVEGLSYIVDNYVLIGYNNYFYDDKIITKMLEGITAPNILKNISNTIINSEKNYIMTSPKIESLDVFQEIDVSRPSLKLIQANRGYDIHESSIGFHIDRKLTDAELTQEIEYCKNDAKSVIEIFNDRLDYFNAKINILDLLRQQGKDAEYLTKAIRWNTTTLVGNLFANANPDLPKMSNFIEQLDVPIDVKNFWLENAKLTLRNDELEEKNVKINEFGNLINFGFGGLHSDNPGYNLHKKDKLFHIDVASMYPNIITKLGIMGYHKSVYAQMITDRVAYKKTNPQFANTLKLILNKVYGVLNNQYNQLYNPQSMLMVCLYGQTALYNLGKELSQFATIIQMNTDGIYAYLNDEDVEKMNDIIKNWEQKYELKMDFDEYDEIVQRDVNNYIVIDKNENIKVKGDLKRYSNDKYYQNNSLSIVDLAIVNKFFYDIDIIDTITSNLDQPRLYQYIVKCGHTYKGIYDQNGKKYQKVNRVFAVRKGVELFKVKDIDGEESWQKLPNLSSDVKVFNDDLDTFDERLDIDYYYQLALDKYEKYC